MYKPELKKKQCTHHWIIDFPDGPVSVGRCKYCGKVRRFYNYFDTIEQAKKEETKANRN